MKAEQIVYRCPCGVIGMGERDVHGRSWAPDRWMETTAAQVGVRPIRNVTVCPACAQRVLYVLDGHDVLADT